MKTLKYVKMIVLTTSMLLCFFCNAFANDELTLTWDPSNEPENIIGYRLYYKVGEPGPPYNGTGLDQGNSPIEIPVDDLSDRNKPMLSVSSFTPGERYYFVVTAYNDFTESNYSNEVLYRNNHSITYSDGTNPDRYLVESTNATNTSITSVYDEYRKDNIIEIHGDENDTVRLKAPDAYRWNNTEQDILRLSFSTFSPDLRLYVEVETIDDAGNTARKYLKYVFKDYDELGSQTYIEFGLGSDMADGAWHHVERDLASDLWKAQHGVTITSVGGVFFKGINGYLLQLDDISLGYWQKEL